MSSDTSLNGITAFTVGSELALGGGFNPRLPLVHIDACANLVVLNLTGPQPTAEEIRQFRTNLKIGLLQYGTLMIGMISGQCGGLTVILPCGCRTHELESGQHSVWTLVLLHNGVVQELRVATTSDRFSAILERGSQQMTQRLSGMTEAAKAQAVRDGMGFYCSKSFHQLWRMADLTSRFGD